MLPDRWSGVVLANEVLDAVPVHLVARTNGEWLERGVSLDGRGRLAFVDRPIASALLRERASARFPADGDYRSELNPAAEALVSSLARRCDRGLMLLIDYGFPGPEYYHPQRNRGTLMCHYRHRAHDDPLWMPGLQDITSHVDFSSVALAGHTATLRGVGLLNGRRVAFRVVARDAKPDRLQVRLGSFVRNVVVVRGSIVIR